MAAWNAHAVVYPASCVGSEWPVPTWNLLTVRQSLRAAGLKLPEVLSASIRVGATRGAMMGDQSRSKRGKVNRLSVHDHKARGVELAQLKGS